MSTEGQPIKCKAMVARAPKQPLVEEEITVMPPKAGEVRVKVVSNACECCLPKSRIESLKSIFFEFC